MNRITDINADLPVGSYAVFSSRDGRRCVASREDFGVIKVFNDFDPLWGVANTSGVFIEDLYERRLACISETLNVNRLINWLHMCHDGFWSIESEEAETDVKQKKTEFMDLINETYTQTRLYSGMNEYHSHSYTELNEPINFRGKYRVGVEMEVEFNNTDYRDDFVSEERNWFYCEEDGSLDYETGCEIITVPLRPSDAKSVEFWEPLTSRLEGNCLAWDSSDCGLHVHFSREILGLTENKIQESMGKLLYLYHHQIKEKTMNTKIFGRSRCYSEHDGRTKSGDAVELLGNSVLKSKKISEKVGDDMKKKSKESRYFDINITNRSTIEFRKGRGTINPKRVVMIVEYCELMCLYAKATKWSDLSFDGFVSYLRENAKSDMLKQYITDAICV